VPLAFPIAPPKPGRLDAARQPLTCCFVWPSGATAWPPPFKGIWMRDALQKLLIRALTATARALVGLATWLTRKPEK
jgi:hypothetical protein